MTRIDVRDRCLDGLGYRREHAASLLTQRALGMQRTRHPHADLIDRDRCGQVHQVDAAIG